MRPSPWGKVARISVHTYMLVPQLTISCAPRYDTYGETSSVTSGKHPNNPKQGENNMNTINDRIRDLYVAWLSELRAVSPQLLTGNFSNVFCTGVPNGWSDAEKRILIVGEEATWGSRDNYPYGGDTQECQECQKWILDYLYGQLFGFSENRSPFWRRFRRLHAAHPEAAFAWTNIDVINTRDGKALSASDRSALHKPAIRPLLNQVTQIMNPSHVVFFGWHNTSLKHEYPDFIEKLYPNGCHDNSLLRDHGYIFRLSDESRRYIFTYHPSWPKASSQDYLERIINELK